jgi:hypothetical protein
VAFKWKRKVIHVTCYRMISGNLCYRTHDNLFSTAFTQSLGPTQLPIHGYGELLSVVTWPELEANHSHLPIVRPLSTDPSLSAHSAVRLEVALAHSHVSTVCFETTLVRRFASSAFYLHALFRKTYLVRTLNATGLRLYPSTSGIEVEI